MIHKNESPLAGQKAKIKDDAFELGGNEILIEDWWDRVAGISWMMADGNPAAMMFGVRSGMSNPSLPTDNEVLYGKINGLGYLVHINELL